MPDSEDLFSFPSAFVVWVNQTENSYSPQDTPCFQEAGLIFINHNLPLCNKVPRGRKERLALIGNYLWMRKIIRLILLTLNLLKRISKIKINKLIQLRGYFKMWIVQMRVPGKEENKFHKQFFKLNIFNFIWYITSYDSRNVFTFVESHPVFMLLTIHPKLDSQAVLFLLQHNWKYKVFIILTSLHFWVHWWH
jgi:hypothetical protein